MDAVATHLAELRKLLPDLADQDRQHFASLAGQVEAFEARAQARLADWKPADAR